VTPFGKRVEWALKLKGIQNEYVEDIFNERNLLLQLDTVHKKVPDLVHDHKLIAESLITWMKHGSSIHCNLTILIKPLIFLATSEKKK